MTYRVIFLDRATDQLAGVYLAAVEQGWDVAELNATLARMDAGLRRDPLHYGESRAGRTRVWVERPVTVHYEVHEDEQLVLVLTLRYRPLQDG
jgi:hypothetical protein